MKPCQVPLLNGQKEAAKILKLLKFQIAKLPIRLGLAVVMVGNNPASKMYVNIKEKRAKEIGVCFEKHHLPADVSEKKVIALIQKLNQSKKIQGILVQLPLPNKFNTQKIIQAIDEKKDVDGLRNKQQTTNNKQPEKKIVPPTIQAIWHLIKMTKIYPVKSLTGQGILPKAKLFNRVKNKKAVILANSLEFAEPLKFLLEKKRIKTDIILKPKSRDAIYRVSKTDIIVIAIGKKHWLKPQMLQKNATVVDVGINRVGKKIYGDVHPDCFKKSKFVSPVPGGVGPLTVAYLFKNLFRLAKKHL